MNDDSGYQRRGETEVDGFVLLQLHVDISQLPADQRIVPVDHAGERLGFLARNLFADGKILKVPFRAAFRNGNSIGCR